MNIQTGIEPRKIAAYDAYLTYKALGGIITTDTGKLETMTQQQFCDDYNVSHETLRQWKKQPGFALKVRERRSEIVPLARETALFNKAYMIAMGSKDHKAAGDMIKLLVGHFSDLQLPVQREKVEVTGNLTELFRQVEKREVIEGEVVEQPDTRSSAANAEALPSTP